MKMVALLACVGAFSFLSVLFPAQNGLAEQTKVYTLQESIDEALANNWKLRAKEEKINQSRYIKNQARAEFLPKLSTSYGYRRDGWNPVLKSPEFGEFKIGTLNNFQWKGTVTQPLFAGFALLSNYRLAELGVDQSEARVALERLDLVFRVKTAYFDILTADMAVETALKAAEALESHAEVARNFYKVGMIPINDLLESEVNANNAKHDLISARNNARLTRCAFNTILSRPVNAPVDVAEIKDYDPVGGSFQDYLEKALKDRPEMKLIRINILQTDQQVRLAGSDYYPEVTFTWDYIKQGDTASVSGSDYHEASQWQAMAGLTWTFWEWGKTHYSVKEQESVKNELLKTQMELEDQIQLEIKDAFLGLETSEANIPITRKAVEQGEENLRVSQERYKAQVTTSTEVLDAQRYLTRARVNHFTALYQYHEAKARLMRAIGSY